MPITGNDLISIIQAISKRMHDERDALCELDRAIGDGDHGVAMDIGWTSVSESVEALRDPSVTEIFHTASQVFLRSVGATVGPLYATGLLDMSVWARDHQCLTSNDILPLFETFVNGLERRGRATMGEKTMIDVWVPALNAFRMAIPNGSSMAVHAALQAAREGYLSTANMVAVKGRASRLGTRSEGHVDPGARSAYLLLETVAQWFSDY